MWCGPSLFVISSYFIVMTLLVHVQMFVLFSFRSLSPSPPPLPPSHLQAMIGIAFSVGFILGPIVGAAFSIYGVKALLTTDDYPFLLPALFAVAMASLDVLYLWRSLPETHMERHRVN